MQALLNKIGVNEKLTRPKIAKQKVFNKFKNNLPKIANYNQMADLLYLPVARGGWRYLLVVCDLATDKFDIEEMREKSAANAAAALKNIYKRGIIKKPYASMKTDSGSEFKGTFDEFLRKNGILHKTSLPDRHQGTANVEALNGQLARLFNGYMNKKEQELGVTYRNWIDITSLVRKELNKIREKKLKDHVDPADYPVFDIQKAGQPKFKVGDLVHYKLDSPQDALGNKQNTKQFRVGDYRFSHNTKEIKQLLYFNDPPYYRYILNGLPHVSYSEYELIL